MTGDAGGSAAHHHHAPPPDRARAHPGAGRAAGDHPRGLRARGDPPRRRHPDRELDLATLLEQDPVDLAKVETKTREVAQFRADLRIARLRAVEQGKAVLTAGAAARLQAMLSGGMHHGLRQPGCRRRGARPTPACGSRAPRTRTDDDLEGRRRRMRAHGRRDRPGRGPIGVSDHGRRGGPGACSIGGSGDPAEPRRPGRQGPPAPPTARCRAGAADRDAPAGGPGGVDLVIEAITENPVIKKERSRGSTASARRTPSWRRTPPRARSPSWPPRRSVRRRCSGSTSSIRRR